MLLTRETLAGCHPAGSSPEGGGALRRIISSLEKSDGRAFTVKMTFRRFAEPRDSIVDKMNNQEQRLQASYLCMPRLVFAGGLMPH